MKSIIIKKKKKERKRSKLEEVSVEEGKKCFPFTREEEWQEWIGEVRTVPRRWRWRQPMKVTVASPSSAQRSVSLSSHRCTVLAVALGCPFGAFVGCAGNVASYVNGTVRDVLDLSLSTISTSPRLFCKGCKTTKMDWVR